MADSGEFWDERADKYSKKPVKDTENYTKTLDCTRKHLSASDEVLEVGCGTGTTALLLAPSVKQITASDISSQPLHRGPEVLTGFSADRASSSSCSVMLRRTHITDITTLAAWGEVLGGIDRGSGT